jgi:hypothetical protein
MRIGRWLHNKIVNLRPGAMDANKHDVHWMNPGRAQDFEDSEMMRKMADIALAEAAEEERKVAAGGGGGGGGSSAGSSAEDIAAHVKAKQEQVPPPSIAINWGRPVEETTAWEGAHVDINWVNRQNVKVVLLRCSQTDCEHGKISASGSTFEPVSEGLDPGQGMRSVSHEYDRWEARTRTGNTLVGRWWIDRSNGLLQDIAI